jgi:hypothetical protein
MTGFSTERPTHIFLHSYPQCNQILLEAIIFLTVHTEYLSVCMYSHMSPSTMDYIYSSDPIGPIIFWSCSRQSLCKHTLTVTQQWNQLTMHFSECVSAMKPSMAEYVNVFVFKWFKCLLQSSCWNLLVFVTVLRR